MRPRHTIWGLANQDGEDIKECATPVTLLQLFCACSVGRSYYFSGLAVTEENIRRRVAQFTLGIDPAACEILEIGALHRPTFSPSQPNVKFADHLPTADLRRKWSNVPDFDPSQIVDVDFVVEGNDYARAVDGRRFDLVLASHVIEHVPDPLGWFEQMGKILKPEGLLSLIVPDRRFTFDVLRRETTWTDLLAHYTLGTRQPDLLRILDHLAEAVATSNGVAPPLPIDAHSAPRQHTIDQVVGLAHQLHVTGEYFDVHCSVFSPLGFLEALDKLCRTKWPLLLLNSFFETAPGEIDFFVSFKAMPPDVDRSVLAAENVSRIASHLRRGPLPAGSS